MSERLEAEALTKCITLKEKSASSYSFATLEDFSSSKKILHGMPIDAALFGGD